MKREIALSLIEAFLRFLHDNGYTDSDVYDERPTAIDQFMQEYSEYFTLDSSGEEVGDDSIGQIVQRIAYSRLAEDQADSPCCRAKRTVKGFS